MIYTAITITIIGAFIGYYVLKISDRLVAINGELFDIQVLAAPLYTWANSTKRYDSKKVELVELEEYRKLSIKIYDRLEQVDTRKVRRLFPKTTASIEEIVTDMQLAMMTINGRITERQFILNQGGVC